MRFTPLIAVLLLPGALAAQTPAGLAAERADFANWLRTSPSSPFAAILHQPLEGELVFGPGGHGALAEAPSATLSEGRRGLALETEGGTRIVPRHRDVALGDWRLRVSGPRGVNTVTVFGPLAEPIEPPGWFDYLPDAVVEGTLERAGRGGERRMLGLDAVEVEATLAGTFEGELLGQDISLAVYRIPVHGSDETELTIFFRDETGESETYPPGRFLVLQPLGGRAYRADFNRARNPFCAYNVRFPCPLPWSGNALPFRVEAGELYDPDHG